MRRMRRLFFAFKVHEMEERETVTYDQDPYYLDEDLWKELSPKQLEDLFRNKLTEQKGFLRNLIKDQLGIDIFPIGKKVKV